ncbi:MAG: Ig-like domain-containing protein [Hyphomicrobium sp.]
MARFNGSALNDVIMATSSNDEIYGGDGHDTISAGDGHDTIDGGNGNDVINAGDGNDTANGGAGDDVIVGGNGNDQLFGDDGNDRLDGGEGNDWLYGGAGNDTFVHSDGNDHFDGGAGIDVFDATTADEAMTINLASGKIRGDGNSNITGIENVVGSKFADTITGDSGANVLAGNGGNDYIYAGAGNDTIIAAAGNGRYFGESNNDTLSFRAGTSGAHVYDGGTGIDTVQLHISAAQVTPAVIAELQNFLAYAATPLSLLLPYQFSAIGNLKVVGVERLSIVLDGVETTVAGLANAAPVVSSTSASSLTLAHGDDIASFVSATDANGDTLTYTIANGPAHGTVTLNAGTGAYTFAAGDHVGNDSFTIRVSDGKGGFDDHTVAVTLTNDAPVVSGASTAALTVGHGKSVSGVIAANDADGDTLGYTVSTGPAHGTVTLDAGTGQYTYTANDHVGSDTFVLTVGDGHGGVNTHTVTVDLTNDAPTVDGGSTAALTVGHGKSVSGVIAANDADGDTLGYTVSTGPAHGTVTLDATSGQYTYTANDHVGGDTFVLTVGDGHGGVSTHTVTVDLTNDAPTVDGGSTAALTVGHGKSVSGVIAASDADGDAYSFTIESGPQHGAVVFTDGSGSYVYTAGDHVGGDSFTIRVADGFGGFANHTVAVNATNEAPIVVAAASTSAFTLIHGQTAAGLVVAGDADGDSLSYAVKSGPAHGALSVHADGTFTFVAEDFAGTDSFVVAISDGHGGVAEHTVTFGVHGTLDVSNNATSGALNLTTDAATGVDASRLTWAINVIGTNFNDVVIGDARANVLFGGLGNDELRGLAGDDTIDGGKGDDKLFGDDGVDNLRGGEGNDALNGGAHNDQLHGEVGNDGFFGGGGNDRLYGGVGNDRMYGDGGDDLIVGGIGNDIMTGAGFNNGGAKGANTYLWARADVIAANGASAGFDHITDFGAGDRLDFSGMFQSRPVSIADSVRVTDTAAGVVVAVDAGGGLGFVDVVMLDNVHAISIDDLTHANAVVV